MGHADSVSPLAIWILRTPAIRERGWLHPSIYHPGYRVAMLKAEKRLTLEPVGRVLHPSVYLLVSILLRGYSGVRFVSSCIALPSTSIHDNNRQSSTRQQDRVVLIRKERCRVRVRGSCACMRVYVDGGSMLRADAVMQAQNIYWRIELSILEMRERGREFI